MHESSNGPLVVEPGGAVLTRTVEELASAQSVEDVTAIVARAVREISGADGATFVLREDDSCFYVDENAIAPLWKGQKFPLSACVSGWAMLNRKSVVIPDIFADPRVPVDAYRPTFVSSLAMAPVRSTDPIGAIGAYWANREFPSAEIIRQLETLADSAAVAIENVELRGAVDRRVEERDRFAARADELETAMHSIVHDLRSPLGAMTGFADLIASGMAGEKTVAYAEAILRAGERMKEQIDRMLSIYRITSQPIVPEPVNLSAFAREVSDELILHARGRDVSIRVEDGLTVHADASLTRLLLSNLLGNAVKYTSKKEQSRIELSCVDRTPTFATFTVTDNGDGFDNDDAARLFTPLTRLHTEAEFPGTGLGLASVARIVELHGGTVRAQGERFLGASFSFSLPTTAPVGIA